MQQTNVDKQASGGNKLVRELLGIAWERLKIISAIVGDVQSRGIAMVFYFTILVPFGVGSRLLSDPLHLRSDAATDSWLQRPPVDSDLESARQQG